MGLLADLHFLKIIHLPRDTVRIKRWFCHTSNIVNKVKKWLWLL